MKRVEIKREIYAFEVGNNCDNKFLIIEEELDGELQLQVYKGWDYRMWPDIGERGAMCEVGELFIRESNKDVNISIEKYIKIYRNAFKDEKPIEKIFDNYNIKALAKRDKKYDKENRYYIKDFEKYKLEKTNEKDGVIFYAKEISTVEELNLFPFKVDERGLSMGLKFSKK